MTTLELILRFIGVALLVTLCVILLRARVRDLKSRALAGLAASVSAFLLTSISGADEWFGVAIYPMTALCSTHPVWFWLASLAMFSDIRTLHRSHVVSLVGMALLGVLYQSLLAAPTASTSTTYALGIAFGIASLSFAGLAPLSVYLGFEGDLDERRRRIRRWFVPAASLYLALVVATQFIVLIHGRATPQPLVLLNIAAIDAVAALALSTFVRFRVVNWLAVVETAAPVALSHAEQSVLKRLNARFLPERLYARQSLTITELAGLLGTQEHVLRHVINGGLGFRSFSDFLHCHRLGEASLRLRDPAARRIPVLTIALDVGYGSIGPFNRAFKERFGMTPTRYRRAPDIEVELTAEPFPSRGR
ncbi:MAG TPA: AraC family transcriptional regulator [Steroidobacteraceae bacterium]|nr:AraC family transcriptional regulator [Steroidobacteraceae bacterium]